MAQRYNTPEKGTVDWHEPLNENFELLDQHVEVRDTESNLGNYAPEAGAKFLATDTGRRFIGDGSQWRDASLTVPSVASDPTDPTEGQLWYNTEDNTLRASTADGIVDVATADDETGDSDDIGEDDDSSSTYYDGATVYTSDYSSLSDAVAAASARDRVLVDTDHTLDTAVRPKSDMLIRGAGGTIQAADGTNQNMLQPEDGVQNLWIDGVTIDGGWQGPDSGVNVGVRLIGGLDFGDITNIRITNCTLRNSGLNAIELVNRSGGVMSDIYIADNTIERSRNHGIILGIKETEGSLHDVIIESNTVRDSYDAQGIGVFGQSPAEEFNTAILDNTVDNSNFSHTYGTNIAFEERADNNVAYANEVIGYPLSNRGGVAATKDADNNILGNNRVSNCARSLQVQNLDYFEPEGPPRRNLVVQNYVTSGTNGFYYNRLDGDLHVFDNLIEDVGTVIADGGDNTGSNYTFYSNGSSVSSSSVGLPDSVGTSVSYQDSDGNTVGTASWSRGSPSPDDPVSVSVSTNV